MDSLVGHTVLNLSDLNLSESQVSTLEKGLTFCPTPGPPNKAKIWMVFKEFNRRLCLKFHFYNDNQMFVHLSDQDIDLINFMAENLDEETNPSQRIHRKFVDKSDWKTSRVHQSLDIFQRSFKLGLLNSKVKHARKPNLTRKQLCSLRELSENSDIVIKKANKGSAVVVMNTTDYLREGYRQLSDTKFYTKLEHDPTEEVAEKVTKTLTQMKQKGLISDKNFEHLNPVNCFILDLLKLVLHSMNFTFNGDHYLQTGRTAMGNSLVPNYANLFMDRFETKALAGFPQKPLTWKRFIDDIFLVWTHGEESLKTFIDYLNSLHKTIKFTHEMSYSHIDFLDTTVKFGPDRGLITSLVS